MAIKISPKTSSPLSLVLIGGLTLILIGSFFYLLIFKTSLIIRRAPTPPSATIAELQRQLSTIQEGGETSAIIDNEVFQKAVTFGGLPLQPPKSGRDNPFAPY